jgi:hypothetical protein
LEKKRNAYKIFVDKPLEMGVFSGGPVYGKNNIKLNIKVFYLPTDAQ